MLPIKLNLEVLAAPAGIFKSGLVPPVSELPMTIEFVILNVVVALTPPPVPVPVLSASAILLAMVEF